MGTLLLSSMLLFILSGTGPSNGSKYQSEDSIVAVGQEQSNKTSIVLDAFRIVDSDGGSADVVLHMDKKGKCYVGKQFLGTFTAAGELKSETGEVLVSLKGDQLLSNEGKVLLVIREDGTIARHKAKDVTWGADGRLTNSELGLKLVPVDSKAKRAASILLYSFMGLPNMEASN